MASVRPFRVPHCCAFPPGPTFHDAESGHRARPGSPVRRCPVKQPVRGRRFRLLPGRTETASVSGESDRRHASPTKDHKTEEAPSAYARRPVIFTLIPLLESCLLAF
jgi:hypothetical protein